MILDLLTRCTNSLWMLTLIFLLCQLKKAKEAQNLKNEFKTWMNITLLPFTGERESSVIFFFFYQENLTDDDKNNNTSLFEFIKKWKLIDVKLKWYLIFIE